MKDIQSDKAVNYIINQIKKLEKNRKKVLTFWKSRDSIQKSLETTKKLPSHGFNKPQIFKKDLKKS